MAFGDTYRAIHYKSVHDKHGREVQTLEYADSGEPLSRNDVAQLLHFYNRNYGIMGLRNTIDDLQKRKDKNAAVLADTARRNVRNEARIRELEALLKEIAERDIEAEALAEYRKRANTMLAEPVVPPRPWSSFSDVGLSVCVKTTNGEDIILRACDDDTVTHEYKVVDGHNQATLVAQYVMRCVNAYDAIRVKVRKALCYGEEGKEKVS